MSYSALLSPLRRDTPTVPAVLVVGRALGSSQSHCQWQVQQRIHSECYFVKTSRLTTPSQHLSLLFIGILTPDHALIISYSQVQRLNWSFSYVPRPAKGCTEPRKQSVHFYSSPRTLRTTTCLRVAFHRQIDQLLISCLLRRSVHGQLMMVSISSGCSTYATGVP